MKKLFLAIVCALVANLAGYAFATSAILLQHEGTVKTYENVNLLSTAIEEAVEGDTIFLGVGTYPSFTMDKKITVCGVGDGKTIINGPVSIDIVSTTPFEATALIGLKVGLTTNENINVNKSTDGLEIKQCAFSSLTFTGKHDNFKMISCYCDAYLNIPYNKSNAVNSATIVNSKIWHVAPSSSDNTSSDIYFKNCNIHSFYNNKVVGSNCRAKDFKGTLENCILGTSNGGSGGTKFSNMSMMYTLYSSSIYSIGDNVYTGDNNINYPIDESSSLIDDNLDCIYSAKQLEELGYLGSDDTIVGCCGGPTPYTLTLHVPQVNVEKSSVIVDENERVLKVDITVTPAN